MKILILLALSWLTGCSLQEPSQTTVTDPAYQFWGIRVLNSYPLGNNEWYYQIEIGPLDYFTNGYSLGPAIQIDDEVVPRKLKVILENNHTSYLWEFNTINRNVWIPGFGHFQRDANQQISWAVAENWQMVRLNFSKENKAMVKEINGQTGLYISFSDGKIEPAAGEPLLSIKAIINVSQYKFYIGENVAVDGSQSYTNVGSIKSWRWDFGDGIVKTGKNASHIYSQAGSYQLTLTVVNTTGDSSQTSVTLEIQDKIYQGGEIGDDFVRFSWDHPRQIVQVWMNFNHVQGQRGREYVFGNFNGADLPWTLMDKNSGLHFDLKHHIGWAYVEVSYTNRPIIPLEFGFSGWYEPNGYGGYDFSQSHFGHMDPNRPGASKYLQKNSNNQTYDFKVLIKSSGQIDPWP